jgi:hypothetical protein
MYAVVCNVLVGRCEPNESCGGAKPLRCGGEKNDGRIETREPEHFHPIGPLRRVDREIVIPTVRRALLRDNLDEKGGGDRILKRRPVAGL